MKMSDMEALIARRKALVGQLAGFGGDLGDECELLIVAISDHPRVGSRDECELLGFNHDDTGIPQEVLRNAIVEVIKKYLNMANSHLVAAGIEVGT